MTIEVVNRGRRGSDELMNGEILTFTGRLIKPLDPDPRKLNIVDIAHALSNNCRYTGHTKEFYSVGEHSVRCSYLVPPRYALCALLHDASEAYLSDIARPVKRTKELYPVYSAIEKNLMNVIAARYEFPWPEPKSVKWADEVMLRSEQRDLMPPLRIHEGDDFLDHVIEPWLPAEAKRRFLARYEELTGIKPRR